MLRLVGLPLFWWCGASAQVTTDWVASFNGLASNADNAYTMTVDRQGNVLVAGEARTGVSTDDIDYAIVKYASDGDTLWIQYFNGTGNKRDIVRSLAVDDSENVYVTGESYGTANYDILTVKFDADGNVQWSKRYDGPAGGEDGGAAVAVSSSGEVFVTGYSDGNPSPVLRQDDLVLLKYDRDGIPLWTRRYDGPAGFHDVPHALAVDSAGNAYVAGESAGSGTGYDYLTLKFSASGDSLWGDRFAGTSTDKAMALWLDKSGNAYVTGSTVAGSNEDYATIKYSSNGAVLWTASYSGPGGGDDAFAIVGDDRGSVYVTGESRGPGPTYTYDYLTIRYDALSGDTIWTARYDGEGKGFDAALSIAVDHKGNVFVTGYSTGNSSGSDFATVAYDSMGLLRWAERYTSAGSFSDIAVGVDLDTAGHIYVAGRAHGGVELSNFVTIRYTDTGSPVSATSKDGQRPEEFFLGGNYPNPFNPVTTIEFSLPKTARVRLAVYDMLGREVAILVDRELVAGRYSAAWDAAAQASGVYVYRMEAGGFVASKKLTLIK